MKTKTVKAQSRAGFVVRPLLPLAVLVALNSFCLAGQEDQLTENVLTQIRALESEKLSRSRVERKLDSQLVFALKLGRFQKVAEGVTKLQPGVNLEPDGRVLVDFDASVTESLMEQIKNSGGTVINSYPQFHAIRALIPMRELEQLAGAAQVKFIRPASRAYTNVGSVTTEGDVTHEANLARNLFGQSGQGVKIGVLSDSIDGLHAAQISGDLGDVTVLPGQSGSGSGEGTAMLEIIHDLAPDGELYFATAFNGEASFAQNILDLRSNGCDIIVDDVGYFHESPFQDGLIARAVNTVTSGGALYFASAGNNGSQKDGTSGTWEGDFVDGGPALPPVNIGGGTIHSFGVAAFNRVMNSGIMLDLCWADPLGASTNDYDLFALNPEGTDVIASSLNLQDGTQDPYEAIPNVYPSQRIVIVKASGAGRFLHLALRRGTLAIHTSGAAVGHASAASAVSVAAVSVANSYPNPFTGGTLNPVEAFSSDGPRRVFFDQDGTPVTPGNFSSTGGALRQKPDLAAADGVSTYIFGRFGGTSASAAHAAGIAALVKSYDRGLSGQQIRSALASTALDIEDPGWDPNSGAGIMMAKAALESLPPRPVVIANGMAVLAESCPGGGLDPGEAATVTFSLKNIGAADTTDLVATLVGTGAVSSPSEPRHYGTLRAHDGSTNRPFSFTVTGNCGQQSVATLRLQDGTNDLGVANFRIVLGGQKFLLSENFDALTPPQLPGGWGATRTGATTAWVTTNLVSDTPPIALYAADPPEISENFLISPVLRINSASAQLSFSHSFDLEEGYDGGVLEISINGAGFQDILDAGGTFSSHGYNEIIDSSYGNPIGTRLAWTGYSDGFVTTVVNLPSSAVGKNVRLRWRLGTDESYGYEGWYIDTVSVTEPECCVSVPNNLVVGLVDSPDPVVAGDDLTYSLNIFNTGPAPASGVSLTNVLPDGFTFRSVTVSQGVSPGPMAKSGGTLTFNLGNLPGGNSASITIVGTAERTGLMTNRVTISRSDQDGNMADNVAAEVTTVTLPALSIADATILEGDSGNTNAVFSVTLSPVGFQTATVQFATSNLTAVAGRDYVDTAGTLVFAPGVTNLTIAVPIIGDLLNEASETFMLNLSRPTNAVLARKTGLGTILNNDPLPNVTVSDSTTLEITSQPTNSVFDVSLSMPGELTVTVYCGTSDGTAIAGRDYVPIPGTQVTFEPGETKKSIVVAVKPHASVKPQQTYYLNLFSPANAKLGRSQGLGTIVTALPGYIDHFVWSEIPSPQSNGLPFAVTLTPKDYLDNPVVGLTNLVALSGTARSPTILMFNEGFEDGSVSDWTVGFDSVTRQVTSQFAAAGTNSFTMTGGQQNHLGGISHSLPNIRPGRVEFYVRASVNNLAGGYFVIGTGGDNPQFAVFFHTERDATMGVYEDAHGWHAAPYAANHWYKITFALDWLAHQFDFLVDDSLVEAKIPFRGQVEALTMVYLYNFDSTQCWWDELRFIGGDEPSPIPISPRYSEGFVAGSWNGNVAVQLPGTNVTLLADDGLGHVGRSSIFDVVAQPGQTTHFVWDAIPSPQSNGSPFTVSITAQDYFNERATNFTRAVALSAIGEVDWTTNTVLNGPSHSDANSGAYTFGYSFTPSSDLTVTHFRHYFGTRVAIWTDAGALLASRVVTSAPGTWRETALTVPLQLSAGQRYRIGVYTGGGNYYWRWDLGGTFADGTIDQAYETSGNAFPNNQDSVRWWFVDFKYTVPARGAMPLRPTQSASFVDGVWSGDLTLFRAGTNVAIWADDGFGHLGQSPAFDVTAVSGQVTRFAWSDIASPQTIGEPIPVTLVAKDYLDTPVSNFVGTVALSAQGVVSFRTNSTLADATHSDSYNSGTYTIGNAFTPSKDLVVTHFRHYSGSKVSLWTDSGQLLARRNVVSVPGRWTETPLLTPIKLVAGRTYRVGFYTDGNTYYGRFDQSGIFPDGVIKQTYFTYDDGFPVNQDAWRFIFVDIRYSVPVVAAVPIVPSQSGSFSDSLWSGDLTLLQSASGLVLRAEDEYGRFGLSRPFEVAGTPRLSISVGDHSVVLSWPKVVNQFTLEKTASPTSTSNWFPVSEPQIVIGNRIIVTNSTAPQQMFYRLRD